ncbi:F0F1 ATP synthase subunit delta [Mucilaginibacter sp. X4EP1]|uniref:F0F1 ATP synthase subunit delta n=1 Tax=Mucilaginibacter sp. X4EP1 TaxID=2723092 RepID=UPI002167475E|nr:F0F1 ATP synthase subunit delta [Mucilaginibacter sp. X4EP1]MCS3812140.1 F-type H+-transporting ATPase subunit b [Mucilaginibacter sp. X4EP1]
MQINWFTVIAQILNFLVLVWLMKRYLYKPILDMIDAREKKIAGQLADAKATKSEAKAEQDEFNKKNRVFDQQKNALMDKAIAEVGVQSQKLLAEAKNNARALQDKLEKAAKDQQADVNHQREKETEKEVFAITKKVLADLADVDFEAQSVHTFIKRINGIKEAEKATFIKALHSASGPILVQSAFDLPEKQQAEIKSAVTKILGAQPSFEFKTAPGLIGGIELTTKGYTLGWSITAYVNSFEKSIGEAGKQIPVTGKKHHAIK